MARKALAKVEKSPEQLEMHPARSSAQADHSPSIDRLERPSPEAFHENYVRKNRPVIITGVASEWEAISRWSPEYFYTHFPDAKVNFTAWQSKEPSNDPTDYYRNRKRLSTRLGSFIESMNSTAESSRNYISQFPIFESIPELKRDIESLDRYMKIPGSYPNRLQSKLKREGHLWLGPAGTVTPVHFDSAHNLLVQIYGRKKVILVPPTQSRQLYYPCLRLGHINYSPVDVEQPDFEKFPRFREATPLEFQLNPGEILFIPVRWWHYLRALDQTISLNFWWFSIDSLFRMRHPYLTYHKHRLIKGLSRRLKVRR
jgi:lysine-specific demethylase 8